MPVLTNQEKQQRLGEIGEKIVRNWLTSQGKQITDSINPYDWEKDFMVGDKKVEVKTQVAWMNENAHTFLPKQLKKVKNCDIFYVISVENDRGKSIYDNCILEINTKEANLIKKVTKDGREMYLIKRDDRAVKIVHKIENQKDIQLLKQYSTSTYIKRG